MHYTRQVRHGDPTLTKRPRGPLVERLLHRVEIDPESLCWQWTGALTFGYGSMRVGQGRTRQVHRIAHEVWIGPIPAGHEVDHTCHDPRWCAAGPECPHRRCFNPDHLTASLPKSNSAPERRRTGRRPTGDEPTTVVRQYLHDLMHDQQFVQAVAARLTTESVEPRDALAATLLA